MEAAPVEAAPVEAAPEVPAPPLDGVASEGNLDEEIDAVIDEAVGPREPWPSESGILSATSLAPPPGEPVPTEAVSAGSVPAEAVSAEAVAAVESASPTPSAGVDGESVPIFSYATAGLIDLSEQVLRMQAPQPNTLVFPVQEDGFVRAETITAHVGVFTFEEAHRRAKGQFTDELLVDIRGRFMKVLGDGILLCDAGDEHVFVLDLYDDFIYLRSEYLFAFESTLHWENGKVRGAGGPIELIHMRGEGRLALVGADKLRKVRLVPEQDAYVSEDSLVGWLGRISPQTLPLGKTVDEDSALKPMLRCEGEGVLLVRSASALATAVGED